MAVCVWVHEKRVIDGRIACSSNHLRIFGELLTVETDAVHAAVGSVHHGHIRCVNNENFPQCVLELTDLLANETPKSSSYQAIWNHHNSQAGARNISSSASRAIPRQHESKALDSHRRRHQVPDYPLIFHPVGVVNRYSHRCDVDMMWSFQVSFIETVTAKNNSHLANNILGAVLNLKVWRRSSTGRDTIWNASNSCERIARTKAFMSILLTKMFEVVNSKDVISDWMWLKSMQQSEITHSTQ
jgi:hypothetical protein